MEKIPRRYDEKIIFADHLEELNDLRYARNAPLEYTKKNWEDLDKRDWKGG